MERLVVLKQGLVFCPFPLWFRMISFILLGQGGYQQTVLRVSSTQRWGLSSFGWLFSRNIYMWDLNINFWLNVPSL